MDFVAYAAEQLQSINETYAAGMKVGEGINRVALQALNGAYADALKDPNVVIPSPLHCAIENILRLGEEK